jgi:hypothetical protein
MRICLFLIKVEFSKSIKLDAHANTREMKSLSLSVKTLAILCSRARRTSVLIKKFDIACRLLDLFLFILLHASKLLMRYAAIILDNARSFKILHASYTYGRN